MDADDAKQTGIKSLSENYYCDLYQADFIHDNRNANLALRKYVSDKTNGLIDNDFNLNESTVFAIVNALYLKDVWNSLGSDLPLTETAYTFKGKTDKKINLMQGYYFDGKAIEEENFSHFYTQTKNEFKLSFIVPKDGVSLDEVMTAENIEKAATASYIKIDSEKQEHYYTRCLFPQFKASCDSNDE